MPKGYWVAHNDVHNPELYKEYLAASAAPFAQYGAKFLVRGGRYTVAAGESPARHVVIEFKDYETALACHNSAEYQEAAAIRKRASTGTIVLMEGCEP